MITDENKTTNSTGSDNNQSNLQNVNQSHLPEIEKLDELDIDLNLDHIDLPTYDFDQETINSDEENTNSDLETIDSFEASSKEDYFGENEQLSNLNPDYFQGDNYLDLAENTQTNNLTDEIMNYNQNSDLISDQILEQNNDLDLGDSNVFEENEVADSSSLGDDFQDVIGIEEEPTMDSNVEHIDDDWISAENQKVEEILNQNDPKNDEKVDLQNFEISANNVIQEMEPKKTEDFSDLFATNETEINLDQNTQLNDAIKNTENFIKDIEQKQEGFIFDTSNNNYTAKNADLDNIKNLLNSSETGEVELPTAIADEQVQTDVSNNVEIGQQNINIDDLIKSSNFEPINIDDLSSSNSNISLDSIVETPILTGHQQIVVENQPAVVQSKENTETISTTVAENIITEIPIAAPKKKSGALKIFVIFFLLLLGGMFILSKMYPEEIRDIMSAIKNGNSADIGSLDDLDMERESLDTEDDVEIDLDEEIDPESLAGQLEQSDMEEIDSNLGIDEDGDSLDIDDSHGSAEDFNAFESLEDILKEDLNENDNLLVNLREYMLLGEEFVNWGTDRNNDVAVKHGRFILNISMKFVEDIESGLEIDTSKVEEYIVKFDAYLSRLNELRDEFDNTNQVILDDESASFDESKNNT